MKACNYYTRINTVSSNYFYILSSSIVLPIMWSGSLVNYMYRESVVEYMYKGLIVILPELLKIYFLKKFISSLMTIMGRMLETFCDSVSSG